MTLYPYTFRLQTGWFEIQVDCEAAPDWFPFLKQRYAPFFAATGLSDSPLQISVLPAQTLATTTKNKAPQFTEDGVVFTQPGWEGSLDFSHQSGWIRPASSFFIEEIDYFMRVACALQAFRMGGLLFHAAGVVREERAYLFLGPSGAGKTTISRLSGENNILNDDLVLLRSHASGWTVYSTPFFNPTQVAPRGGKQAPLAGMYGLVQDSCVYLEIPTPGQALAELVASVPVVSTDTRRAVELLTRCQSLIADVPVLRLHFRKDDSFWELINHLR